MVNSNRIRSIKRGEPGSGPVVYWMSRDQRGKDNWALIHAGEISRSTKKPLVVAFNLVPDFLGATARHYYFMGRGLEEVSKNLIQLNIPLAVLAGEPEQSIPEFLSGIDASVLIGDFSPLKIYKKWKKRVASKIRIPFYEVDAHNIVPCWVASDKREYGAYTIRPKIHRLLEEYLEKFPSLKKQAWPKGFKRKKMLWDECRKYLQIDSEVKEVDWIKPGERAAANILKKFLEKKIGKFAAQRNDPHKDAQSDLSPYLHFGQISAQRIALDTIEKVEQGDDRKAFLEELIVRRELSDNFCFYSDNYNSISTFPDWAKKTLKDHQDDEREYLYSKKEFEQARTHDELWNAAQLEMVRTGKMHGYMRMYWAKKILEWSSSPRQALRVAIYLNDRYSLDGRDPNGYAGIAWSIGGVHDRAWGERPIFGKIRYMSYNGCRSKFDVKGYIKKNIGGR